MPRIIEDNKNITLDGLDGYQFEELIAKIMKKRGYKNIKVTQKSRDAGKDIIMEDENGEIILVECKHQHFVGRPIIQKLQGAINHEEIVNNNKNIKGMVVTSGNFSKEAKEYNKEIGHEIELIDGNKLRKICRDLNIVVLNGKVQILTNKSFKNLSEKESKEFSASCYSKVYGYEKIKSSIKSNIKFFPACYIIYYVNFNTYTSIGCIDSYNNSGEIIIDGATGYDLRKKVKDFFFKGKFYTEEINDKYTNNKIPYEFTENDLEEDAINQIIQKNTHQVRYTGMNNVTYIKRCVPKRRDIDIKEFLPLYLPLWKNNITIKNEQYIQEFYTNDNKQLFLNDSLKVCKICERKKQDYQNMSVCPECGRIVCQKHVKIDYLDKETPICTLHVNPFRLFIQKKYFASKDNLKKYESKWKTMNFFRRLYEDKIIFSFIIVIEIITFIILIYNITTKLALP